MKLRLSINQEPITGYMNIDPVTKDDRVTNGVIQNLDMYCEDAICTEIILDNYLDSVNVKDYGQVLGLCVKKLRLGGVIKVVATDCYEVCRKMFNGDIDPIEFNRIIHGTTEHPLLNKSGQATMYEIQQILEHFKLVVEQKEIIETTYCISARRVN